ncbi:MAG: hypothetical protein NWE77_01905 [Candidatus Bathyarchaeota archaeon]|nr:hypothetical protein [Candidatus Bathyarchaeota archaeon]
MRHTSFANLDERQAQYHGLEALRDRILSLLPRLQKRLNTNIGQLNSGMRALVAVVNGTNRFSRRKCTGKS